jgi:hypothetical protein
MRTSSPDIDLLLLCSRTSLGPRQEEKIAALLGTEIDWDRLIGWAQRHGTFPLLYLNLKKVRPGLVPSAIMGRLRKLFLLCAGQNLILTQELMKILEHFDAAKIPALPFKGPTLAAALYGDLALRPFCDLDILVPKADVSRAKNLLVSEGYEWEAGTNECQDAAFRKADLGYMLRGKSKRVLVEIDWEITPREFPVTLDLALLWERLEEIPFQGRKVSALSPEDLLLTLALHGGKHQWERLIWVCDLAELARVYPLDFDCLAARARELRCERLLWLGLGLAHDLLEAPWPPEILHRVKDDPRVQSQVRSIGQRLFEPPDASGGAFGLTSFYLQMCNNLRDQVRFCFRLIFTPTTGDWESLPLPPRLFFLYYLIHPFRLLGKYGKELWASLRNCGLLSAPRTT